MAWKWKRQLRGAQTARMCPSGTEAGAGRDGSPWPQQHAHTRFAQILSQRFIENWICGAQDLHLHRGSGVSRWTLSPSHIFCIQYVENRLGDLPDELIPSPNHFGFAIKIQGNPLGQMNKMVTTGHQVKKKKIKISGKCHQEYFVPVPHSHHHWGRAHSAIFLF